MKITLLLAWCCAVSAASVLQIPLTRVESLREKLEREGKWERYVATKLAASNATLGGQPGHQTVHDFEDQKYVAQLSIGTKDGGGPAQSFFFLLDTGSSDFWVLNENVCANNPHLCSKEVNKKTFKPQGSRTYRGTQERFSTSYGSGNTFSGIVGVDTVWLGDNNGIRVVKTPMGQVDTVANDRQFAAMPFAGIMGLGRQCTPQSCHGTDQTVFQRAFQQGLVQRDLFTIVLKKDVPFGERGGTFTWGGFDTTNCRQDVRWVPVDTRKSNWVYSFEGVQFGRASYKGSWSVFSDTGIPKVLGPPQVIQSFLRSVGAQEKGRSYYVPCGQSIPSLVVAVGRHQLVVPGEQLLKQDKENPSVCWLQLGEREPQPGSADWCFGVPFYRSYCIVHDGSGARIGFASAVPQ